VLEVDISLRDIIYLACLAISDKRLMRFYYESQNRKADRIIRPYMILPQGKAFQLQLVGTPIEELKKPMKMRQPGHYLLSQLSARLMAGQVKTLEETFDDPGVNRSIVDDTKSPVVCRFIYNDEDKEKIIRTWLKIRYCKK
jgi:hypothetical protein